MQALRLRRALVHTSAVARLPPSKLTAAKSATQVAVDDILYSFPTGREQTQRHILSVLVDNQVGVLSKVTGLLSSRGFNIESLAVSKTNVADLSRMTVVLKCQDVQLAQAERHLEDLMCVWGVLHLLPENSMMREFVMCKLDTKREDALHSVAHRQAIKNIVELFGGKVVDVGSEMVTVEAVAQPTEVDTLMELLRPFKVVEAVRSGTLAISKCKVAKHDEVDLEKEKLAAASLIDESSLPPG
ncbi:acetolactate synthase, small subunit [Batrachochytrium salamandrivorans]|nr:acetolactate synthase, small subunit [Batrachochytrium salamandrivorans]